MKAILVIDQPEDCTECPLYSEDDYGFGCGYGTKECRRHTNIDDTIPTWCPLKPMPQYRDDHFRYANREMGCVINAEARGFNRCLREIAGETE